MWSDNETDIDLLGFQVHSQLIRSVVTDSSLLPVTVGVFGDWGSGKSSVIRMLEKSFEEEEKVACVYFNGWQFEGYDDAKSALIYSILLELAKHQKLGPKVREKVTSLLGRINWLRVFKVGYQTIAAPILAAQLATLTGMPAAPIPPTLDSEALKDADPEELLKQDPSNQALVGVRQFREDFEDLIKETGLSSLVILIDDIDRCEPQRLVETLEAIKLFLSVPQVAFVIGADERIVRYAIAQRYEIRGIEAGERHAGSQLDLVTDYLEKLIQIPYHLPRLSPSEVETYLSLLFCQLRLGDQFSVVIDAFAESREHDITGVFRHDEIRNALEQAGHMLPTDLNEELAWSGRIALPLCDILKGNPRQTKRLLNALLLRKKLAAVANIALNDSILIKLMILEYMRPDLFAQLYKWQSQQQGVSRELEVLELGIGEDATEYSAQIDNMHASGPDWKEPSVAAWLVMSPSLAGQDLRNYFWITRDRITGILSGVTAIPLHLRHLLSDLIETGDSTILSETRSQIVKLAPDEQLVLFNELAAYARREPDNLHAIGVWIAVVQILPAYISKLLNVLEQFDSSSLNSTVPPRLVLIARDNNDYEEKIISLLNKWAAQNTVLGRAATESFKDLRGEQ